MQQTCQRKVDTFAKIVFYVELCDVSVVNAARLCSVVALCQQRSENVEQYNDGGSKDQFTESGCSDYHRERKQHEGVANAVAFPTITLEFERKHGDFTDHNLTRPDDEQEHTDPKDREIYLNGRFAEPYRERTPKEGVGGCGKADEGMTLACVEV